MKPFFLLVLGTAMIPANANYDQSPNINREHIEVIYLPNNTCHISVPPKQLDQNYRNYVKACLNNRHIRIKISQ